MSGVSGTSCSKLNSAARGTGASGQLAAHAGAIARTTRDIGTAHPFMLQENPADGRWLVYCQARADTDGDGSIKVTLQRHGYLAGDRMEPYLLLGDGPELAIDDFVAADAAGNYLVVIVAGRLLLIDTRSGQQVDLSALGANPLDVGSGTSSHRAASFDRQGQRLLYLRKTGSGDIPVVRTLATGQEVALDPGAGLLWRARFDEDGYWVRLQMVVKDTSGDGKLTLPSLMTNLAGRRCRGVTGSYSNLGVDGDEPVERFVPSSGGPAREAADILRPWGERFLVRTPEGALAIENQQGQREELVPASCKGTLHHADVARGLVLVSCKATPEKPMSIYGRGTPVAFTELPLSELGDVTQNPARRLYAGQYALVDLDRRATHRIGIGALVGVHEGRALFARDNRVLYYDADKDTEQEIFPPEHIPVWSGKAGPMVLFSLGFGGPQLVFDLATGRTVGRAARSALAVAEDGRVLVRQSEQLRPGVEWGPFRWEKPVAYP